MNLVDTYTIIATLVIGCLSSLIFSLGNLRTIKDEKFEIIICRIVFLGYSFICGYSFIKFLEIIYKHT